MVRRGGPSVVGRRRTTFLRTLGLWRRYVLCKKRQEFPYRQRSQGQRRLQQVSHAGFPDAETHPRGKPTRDRVGTIRASRRVVGALMVRLFGMAELAVKVWWTVEAFQ
jgi:hypothetical protein